MTTKGMHDSEWGHFATNTGTLAKLEWDRSGSGSDVSVMTS